MRKYSKRAVVRTKAMTIAEGQEKKKTNSGRGEDVVENPSQLDKGKRRDQSVQVDVGMVDPQKEAIRHPQKKAYPILLFRKNQYPRIGGDRKLGRSRRGE